MPDGDNAKALAKYRLSVARDCLIDAELLRKAGRQSAVNRLYYAAFNAIRAILAIERVDFKHHSGVIAHFQQFYVKTDIFPPEMSRVIMTLYRMRQHNDYDAFVEIPMEEIDCLYAEAEAFVNAVEAYMGDKVPRPFDSF